MISIDGLTVEFGGTTLFKDISFAINDKDRIALMGKNGAGKSTMLKIIAGEKTPTRGRVSAPKENIIAYLPQHLITNDNCTVFEEAAKAFAETHEMENEIKLLLSCVKYELLNLRHGSLGRHGKDERHCRRHSVLFFKIHI